jgi:hypothetical protein
MVSIMASIPMIVLGNKYSDSTDCMLLLVGCKEFGNPVTQNILAKKICPK